MSNNGNITAHYIAHWGTPTNIRIQHSPTLPELAIMEFEPHDTRRTWRFATNGMSGYQQRAAVPFRTELYACSLEYQVWIEALLTGIATYPKDYNTTLREGDTIDVGQPIDQNMSPFTGILLVPPQCCDSETLGAVASSENILIHRIVGILPSELEFSKTNGGHELVRRFANHPHVLLDVPRSPVL